MNNYLSAQEKEKIKQAIEKIEAKSSAEIVVAATKSLEDYGYFTIFYSLFFAIFAIFALLFSGYEVQDKLSAEIIIAVFILSYLILSYSSLMQCITPKFIKKHRCNNLALSKFRELGADKKSNHEAIFIFVCLKSRFIKIIADSKINKTISNKIWQNLIKKFILKAKNEKIAEGIIEIINNCGKILVEKFPKNHESKDELSNKIIEI